MLVQRSMSVADDLRANEASMGSPPADTPLVTFYRFIPDIRMPERADSSAAGSIPTRAFRFCEAIRLASAFGWYLFPPMRVSFMWDGGTEISFTYEGADEWYPLRPAAQFPNFAQQFDDVAPEAIKGFSPPFVAALQEPGIVQIWSGIVAQTAPGWSLLVRGPANLPRNIGYEVYEGIVETDRWFGPLFTNIRLTRTNASVELNPDLPLLQVQPVSRELYGNALEQYQLVSELKDLRPEEWNAFHKTIVKPNTDPNRRQGQYAVDTRRRRQDDHAGAKDEEPGNAQLESPKDH
jgi:hypothetical protein